MSETFEVTSGALQATDPCYDTNTWCAGKLENVQNGTWSFTVLEKDGRVAELIAFTKGSGLAGKWEKVKGSFGVDSGQFGFFDYDYFVAHEGEREYGEPGFYNSACNQTLGALGAGIVEGTGVVSSSGWGDGTYDVYVRKNNLGIIVAVKADYFGEDYDEEDEE